MLCQNQPKAALVRHRQALFYDGCGEVGVQLTGHIAEPAQPLTVHAELAGNIGGTFAAEGLQLIQLSAALHAYDAALGQGIGGKLIDDA